MASAEAERLRPVRFLPVAQADRATVAGAYRNLHADSRARDAGRSRTGKRPPLELAGVFQRYAAPFRRKHGSSLEQDRVIKAICECRTAAKGSHLDRYDPCGHEEISYNSCRSRYCARCQGGAGAKWRKKLESELLPVPYRHVVFALPEPFRPIALRNKQIVYDVLFGAASETLLAIARNPRYLGAAIGFFAVLQTWTHDLFYDPHLHVVVPAGGLSPDGSHWIASRKDFPPELELSRRFRRRFLRDLAAAFERGDLRFPGSLSCLADPRTFAELLARAGRSRWRVYAAPPFGGPQRLLRYLAANRTAFSNDRLLDVEGGAVRFISKDYRRSGHRPKAMTLDGVEFVRRFMLHTVPEGFKAVRHFGLFANRHRAKNLRRCRELLATDCAACSQPDGSTSAPIAGQAASAGDAPSCSGDQAADGGRLCPQCGRGRLRSGRHACPSAALPKPSSPRPTLFPASTLRANAARRGPGYIQSP